VGGASQILISYLAFLVDQRFEINPSDNTSAKVSSNIKSRSRENV